MPKPSRPAPPPSTATPAPSVAPAVQAKAHRWDRPLTIWMLLAVLAGAIVAAYSNSFGVPYLLDDMDSIERNDTIKRLSTSFFPPRNSGITVSGRPLLNFTLAVNHRLHGTSVTGYHVANLLIHIAATLALFGFVRRTLRLPSLAGKYGAHATPLALGVAALWALHPLQTESVTYIIQRAESLVGLCYLFTLYAFARSLENGSRAWTVTTVVSCFVGMTAKEVMATAPLAILLYDRTFAAGTFAESWRLRRKLYLWLASSWLLLLVLVISSGGRGKSVGYAAVSATDYALTQASALVRYLRLILLPTDLIFDYGPTVEKQPAVLLRSCLVLVPLLALTVVALKKWPRAGFLGATFFLILGPTSSIVPVATQTIAEHRLYLSIGSVAALAVFGCWRIAGRHSAWIVAALAVVLGIASFQRNTSYRTTRAIWEDTVQKMPDNVRALNNLGIVYLETDEFASAMKCLGGALDLMPHFIVAKSNLGRTYILKALKEAGLDKVRGDIAIGSSMGVGAKEIASLHSNADVQEGLRLLQEALKADPNNAAAAMLYGNALILLHRADPHAQQEPAAEAIGWLQRAVELNPDSFDAHFELANALSMLDRNDEAAARFEHALRLKPNEPTALTNYGALLRRMGKAPAAIENLEAALKLAPSAARIHSNLGVALLESGRTDDGIRHLREAIQLDPDIPQARYNLSNALAETSQTAEAIVHLEALLKIAPPTAELVSNLGVLYAREGRLADSIKQMHQALAIDPGYEPAKENLERILAHLRALQNEK